MLELKKITKIYGEGETAVEALKGVSLRFGEKEFVSILGQSGSGKSTILNIVGGLDRYTSGDLIIDGISTKLYKDANWDSYRNHKIGFVFQSYNLIQHLSVAQNVEIALTISGVSKQERQERARKALISVGLNDHMDRKPKQLSGGQMQRVAIARALVNDPTILLADEPTGALDTDTSLQIMELLKEISKNKLVIMVTHNAELAKKYSTRIVEVKDGSIIRDTNPDQIATGFIDEEPMKKTSMSFFTAMKLSFNNLLSKKLRTIITAFAGSIGIIGVGLVLALSNGFDGYMKKMEREAFSSFPITITTQYSNVVGLVESSLEKVKPGNVGWYNESIHNNNITNEYIKYIKEEVEPVANFVSMQYAHSKFYANLNNDIVDTYVYEPMKNVMSALTAPVQIKESDYLAKVFSDKFDILDGRMFNDDRNEAVLVVNGFNKVNKDLLKFLGFNLSDDDKEVPHDLIVGKEFKSLYIDNYFIKDGNNGGKYDYYRAPNKNELTETEHDDPRNQTVKIVGVVKSNSDFSSDGAGIYYSKNVDKDRFSEEYVNDSAVILNQIWAHLLYNESTIRGTELMAAAGIVGLKTEPVMISIYPKDEKNKKELQDLLLKFNLDKAEADKIYPSDFTDVAVEVMKQIMDTITIVLIVFSSISLIVSSVMIGIITYTSVIERTKEIGILRSVGARKKDISRVFNSETVMIGLFSGVLGIALAYAISPLLGLLIKQLTTVPGLMKLNPLHALLLIVISITLTFIAGLIPSTMASKKDPVTALNAG